MAPLLVDLMIDSSGNLIYFFAAIMFFCLFSTSFIFVVAQLSNDILSTVRFLQYTVRGIAEISYLLFLIVDLVRLLVSSFGSLLFEFRLKLSFLRGLRGLMKQFLVS